MPQLRIRFPLLSRLAAAARVALRDNRGRRAVETLSESRLRAQRTLGSATVNVRTLLWRQPGDLCGAAKNPVLLTSATLDQYVLSMPRRANIIYPRDARTIAGALDLCAGKRVLEAGTGSGALTLYLARAVGATGSVVSFETREDHHVQAERNIRRWKQFSTECVDLRLGAVQDAPIPSIPCDAAVLDMMEPWSALPAVWRHLAPGAPLVVAAPNITQLDQVIGAIRDQCEETPFAVEGVTRTNVEEWVLDGRGRVAHPRFWPSRSAGHTLFLLQATRLSGNRPVGAAWLATPERAS